MWHVSSQGRRSAQRFLDRNVTFESFIASFGLKILRSGLKHIVKCQLHSDFSLDWYASSNLRKHSRCVSVRSGFKYRELIFFPSWNFTKTTNADFRRWRSCFEKKLKYCQRTSKRNLKQWRSSQVIKLRENVFHIVWVFPDGIHPNLRLQSSLTVAKTVNPENLRRKSNTKGNTFRVIPVSVFVRLHAWYGTIL